MVGIVECTIAIGVVTIGCLCAGRFAAITLTIITTAMAALVMPPFLSFRVERGGDVALLLFQSIVGFVVASKLPAKDRGDRQTLRATQLERTCPTRRGSYSLLTVVRKVREGDGDLGRKLSDLDVYGNVDSGIAVSEQELEHIVADVLRIALSHSNVQRVSVYAGRQPALDRITIEAEYDLTSPLPRIRMLGRSDSQCHLQTDRWPPNCSLTLLDNGYEYIYLISIFKQDAV